MSQSENTWNETGAFHVGGKNFSPLFPCRSHSPGCYLKHILLVIDSPEFGPGTILGPAGPSGSFSSSTRPSMSYPLMSLLSSKPLSLVLVLQLLYHTLLVAPQIQHPWTRIQHRGTQLKHGSHCWWHSSWYSGDLDCHCCIVLLLAMPTFTGTVRPVHRQQGDRCI